MKPFLAAALLLGLAGAAQAQSPPSYFNGGRFFDLSNQPYGLWPTLTAGTTYTGLRGFAAHCTAAGISTLTDASGNTMLWDVAIGFQQQPLVPVSFTAVAGCTFYGLN